MQEKYEFNSSLDYIVSSWSAWAMGHIARLCLKKKKNQKTIHSVIKEKVIIKNKQNQTKMLYGLNYITPKVGMLKL
jgi:hypothetical protein